MKITAFKKFKIILFWLIFLLFVFSSLSQSFAQTPVEERTLNLLKKVWGEVTKEMPELPTETDPIMTIVKIINYLLTFIGVIFIIIIIYGGFLWITGSANEEQIKKAKKLIKEAILGLVIIILARVIYLFILERLGVEKPFRVKTS